MKASTLLPRTLALGLLVALTACFPVSRDAPASPAESGLTTPPVTSANSGETAQAPQAADPSAIQKAPVQIAKAPEAAQGTVGIEILPQYGRILARQEGTLDVLIRLSGHGEVSAERPPLDLAVVIDRSGSMSGDKIRAVKEAGLKLLDRLDANDRVTLVSYSDGVATLATHLAADEAGKKTLRKAFLKLRASGMTALGPALIQAIGALEGQAQDGGRLAHVLMFSDGIANVGEKRPEVLGARAAMAFNRGVGVSTLGVGVDYNEDLMTRLADQGGGRYHFIKDGDAVAAVLEDEMKGLVATVARGVELELKAAPGVEVAHVFGYPTTRDGHITRVRIGALGANQTREILVRLKTPAAEGERLDLGVVAAHFKDVPADGLQRKVDAVMAVALTTAQADMDGSENKAVTVRVAEVESADQMEQAARSADKGDFGAAGGTLQLAIDTLERKQRAMPKPSPKLSAQLDDLREAQGELEEAKGSDSKRKEYSKKSKAKAYSARKR